MKIPKALTVTVVLTAALLALAFGLRGQYARLAAEHLKKQLDTVPDDRAAVLLGQVAALGEPGIPVLVEALGSERESVALAGKRILLQQIDRWRTFPPSARSARLAILADALHARVGKFGVTARADAAELAKRVLSWPLDPKAVDRRRVISACEKVLRTTGFGRDTAAAARPSTASPWPVAAPAHAQPRPVEDDGLLHDGVAVAELSRLPGGALAPVMPAEPGSLGPEIPRIADNPQRQPPLSAAVSAPRPGNPLRQPHGLWIEPEYVGRMPETRAPDPQTAPREMMPIQPLPLYGSNDAIAAAPPAHRADAETVDLMRQLHSGNQVLAVEAETELMRRGFRPVDLELARQLFDPDPEVRKRLARMLPKLRSIDPVPWLLQLGRDRDSEVRMTAIGLMATTGDPALLEQIEQIAQRDPDPRIQRQARHIAERWNGPTY